MSSAPEKFMQAAKSEPSIFPGNWTVKTAKLLGALELSFNQQWNPVTLGWDEIEGSNFDDEHRIAQAYFFSKLAFFEKSGIGAFGFGAVRAAELDMEDPAKKTLASITFDECRHDEVCRRACNKLCPGWPYEYNPTTELEEKALRNIDAMYQDGRRYWRGFLQAWEKLPPQVLFAGFFFAEIGAETIFNEMRKRSEIGLYQEAFRNVTRDESRHLIATIALLREIAPRLTESQKLIICRQMKQGFIFLSPLLHRPQAEFWRLPKDFEDVDQKMESLARDAGLGVLTPEEKVESWRNAIEKNREEIERLGVSIPAIPEIGIEGVEVKVKKTDTIATTF